MIVFAILIVAHFWRLKRAGAVYFAPFLIGGISQTIGYRRRNWSHFDKESIGGFVMQAIMILVAPTLFAASIYVILGRLIRALGAEHISLIPIKWVTKISVIGDVIAFDSKAEVEAISRREHSRSTMWGRRPSLPVSSFRLSSFASPSSLHSCSILE